MQYHIQTLVKHLFDKDSFEQVTEQELKQFTEDYPYAAVGQFLYAKKLKDNNAYNYYEQGEQASLYFHNALWLRWQLDHKEEAPALPVRTGEPAQPGFRIVAQMPNTEPVITSLPAETKEEIPAEPAAETPVNQEEPAITEQTIQPVAEQPTAPVREEPIIEEQEKSLQVNEDGSLVEKEATQQQAREEIAPETAPAVAIAEESLIPPAAVAGNETKEEDDIVPAVEIRDAELETNEPEDDIVPAVDVTKVEMEVTAMADDIVPAMEIAPEELAALEPAAEASVETKAEAIETPQAPAEIAIEDQAIEEINEIIPAREPGGWTALPPDAFPIPEQQPNPVPMGFPTLVTPEGKATVDLEEPVFESYHTIDYFASQGIKLLQEELKDKLGKQLKSFTDWLRSMKRIAPVENNTSLDEVANQSIQRFAEHSIEEKEVLTEAMAEVWAKQGNNDKAIRVYEKLSLLNPVKRPYFAHRIEQLKAQ
jgi:hypothetical protein